MFFSEYCVLVPSLPKITLDLEESFLKANDDGRVQVPFLTELICPVQSMNSTLNASLLPLHLSPDALIALHRHS